MAGYFFSSPVDVEIKLSGEDERKRFDMKTEKEKTVSCPIYYDGDTISGEVRLILQAALCLINTSSCKVTVRVRDGKKLAHDGIKVEFVGSIGEFV